MESSRLGPVETQAKKILRKYNLIEGRTDFDQPRSGRKEVLEVRYTLQERWVRVVDGDGCSGMGTRNVFCKTRPLFYILLTFGGRMHNNLKFNFAEKSTKEELMMTRLHRAVRLWRL